MAWSNWSAYTITIDIIDNRQILGLSHLPDTKRTKKILTDCRRFVTGNGRCHQHSLSSKQISQTPEPARLTFQTGSPKKLSVSLGAVATSIYPASTLPYCICVKWGTRAALNTSQIMRERRLCAWHLVAVYSPASSTFSMRRLHEATSKTTTSTSMCLRTPSNLNVSLPQQAWHLDSTLSRHRWSAVTLYESLRVQARCVSPTINISLIPAYLIGPNTSGQSDPRQERYGLQPPQERGDSSGLISKAR